MVLVACSGGAPAARSLTPSPPASPSPSPTPSPSPVVPQQQEPSLPSPIEETAAASVNGKLYVMGGFNAAGASLNSVYVFDGGGWQSGPALPLPLDHPSATTLDDRLYIAGGHSNGRDSARLFRLDGDRWTELAPMRFARGGHALVAVAGKLYAIGGNNSAINVAPVEAYDPAANSWSAVTSLPAPRNHVSGFVAAGKACVAGGRYPTTARVDCLDPGSLAWSRLPDLPQPTSGAGAMAFAGGGAVIAGGQNASETAIVDQVTHYAGSGWTAAEHMLTPRHGFELAMLDGRAWACGGGTAPGLHPVATCTSIADASTAP